MKLLIIVLSVPFLSNMLSAQKRYIQNQYYDILGVAIANIPVNYDSTLHIFDNFKEYVFIDSTKELLSAVQITGFTKKNACNPDTKDKHQILNCEIYKNNDNYGFSSPVQKYFGGNSYLNNETNIIFTLKLASIYNVNISDHPPASCPRISISSTFIAKEYMVNDTVYRQRNVYHLVEKGKKMFYFDISKFSNSKLNLKNVDEEKTIIGTWDSSYVDYTKEFIINKLDYAILSYKTTKDYTDNKGNRFSINYQNEFKKFGKFYFEKSFVGVLPRFGGEKCGFNSKNYYTLIKKESVPVINSVSISKEFDINSFKELPQKPFSEFCIEKETINSELKSSWDKFIQNKANF